MAYVVKTCMTYPGSTDQNGIWGERGTVSGEGRRIPPTCVEPPRNFDLAWVFVEFLLGSCPSPSLMRLPRLYLRVTLKTFYRAHPPTHQQNPQL